MDGGCLRCIFVFSIFHSQRKSKCLGSFAQAHLKCSCFSAKLLCTHLWKTKNLSLRSWWVEWTVICSWAPDASLDFFITPHPFYFSSGDLKALDKPWSSLTPWVILCFDFPRWGGSEMHVERWVPSGWMGGRGWRDTHKDPGPLPNHGCGKGKASRCL